MQRTRTRMGAQEVMRCALCFRLAGWCAPCRLVCAMQGRIMLCCAVLRKECGHHVPMQWQGTRLMRPTRFHGGAPL